MSVLKKAIKYVSRNIKSSIIMLLVIVVSMTAMITLFVMEVFANRTATLLPTSFHDCKVAVDTIVRTLHFAIPVATGIILLVIFMILFLKLDTRKQEVGIYLALGNSKGTVISQMLSEMLMITFPAIPVSVASGLALGNQMARKMVYESLKLTIDEMSLNISDKMASKRSLALSQVEELYVGFDAKTILTALAVICASILLAVLLSNLRLYRLQIKDVLCKSE